MRRKLSARLLTLFAAVLPLGAPANLVRHAACADDDTPTSQPAKQETPARLIAFVCDTSASIADDLPSFQHQLLNAVDGMRPIHSFNILLMQDGAVRPFKKHLIPATPENKHSAHAFVDAVKPSGKCSATAAMKLAFDEKPELIYLFITGDINDQEALSDFIRKRNEGRLMKINTILFCKEKPDGLAQFLTRIAVDNRGIFKYVNPATVDE